MIELRVPISPTPSFVNQVRLLAASLREFYPDAIVRAYIGCRDNTEREAAADATAAFMRDTIAVRYVHAAEHTPWTTTRSPFLATMNARFDVVLDSVSHVILADADVLVMRPFPELFRTDAVQGVMTHVPPNPMPADWIRALWRQFSGHEHWQTYPHSGAGIMCGEDERSPWYVNSGFVFAPRRLFERLIDPYHEAIKFLRQITSDSYWFDQLALGLAVAKARVPSEVRPLRFNFPNQAAFDKAHPDELADVRVLHYLRTDIVDRVRDFADRSAMWQLLLREDLSGSNETLRRRFFHLRHSIMPPP